MNNEETHAEIQRLFPALLALIKTGQFTKRDVDFMVVFLKRCLDGTLKLQARIDAGEDEVKP